MSATTQPAAQPAAQPATTAQDPAIFKILENGTVLYKTYQQAQNAAQQLKSGRSAETAAKTVSGVKYGETYLTKDGQAVPYTLGALVEFQLTGLIVVILVLTGLYLACAGIGRLIRMLERSAEPTPAATITVSPIVSPVATASAPAFSPSTIHPGLTDQQLVVMLTAAATEIIGSPVRIGKLRPLTARDHSWSAQGRSELHSHRLK